MLNTHSSLCFFNSHHALKLPNPVQSFPSASYSSILSLASYIVYRAPQLQPPNFQHESQPRNISDDEFPSPWLSFNDYYEPWCDYLSSLLESNHLFHQQHSLYFCGELALEEFQRMAKAGIFELKELEIGQEGLTSREVVEKVYGIQLQKPEREINIGIANFAISQQRKDVYRPKVNLHGLMQGIFHNNGDRWNKYNILNKDYPKEQDWQAMDVLILTGSSNSINTAIPEVEIFLSLLKQQIELRPKLKVLGLCYGHQALTKMFGGKVVKKELYAGLERVKFNENIKDVEYLPKQPRESYLISQFHSDYADIVPNGFEVIASSQSTSNEAMVSLDRRILSYQYHMEYSTEYTRSYELRVANYQTADPLANFSGTAAGKGSEEHFESIRAMREITRNFIDWKVPNKGK